MDDFNQHKISRHRKAPRTWVIIIAVALLAHFIFFLVFKTEYLKVFERKMPGAGSGRSNVYIRTGDRFELINTSSGLQPEAESREEQIDTEFGQREIPLDYGEPPPGLPSLEGLINGEGAGANRDTGSEAVIKPKPLFIAWPSYPEELERKYQGKVKLELLVNEKGSVEEVRILEGLPSELLNRKAVASAREIRFVPGKKNGKNSPMWVQISIGFKQK